MSTKERERLKVLTSLSEGRISRRIAALQLKISERQLRRLINAYQSIQINRRAAKSIQLAQGTRAKR